MATTTKTSSAPTTEVDAPQNTPGETADNKTVAPEAKVSTKEEKAPVAIDTVDESDEAPRFVQYTGGATVRVIRPDEWPAGVAGEELHAEWNFVNGYRVPEEAFTEDQLAYLLDTPGENFKLV